MPISNLENVACLYLSLELSAFLVICGLKASQQMDAFFVSYIIMWFVTCAYSIRQGWSWVEALPVCSTVELRLNSRHWSRC